MKKIKVKIPLSDYLLTDKIIEEGQILYLQEIKERGICKGFEITISPVVYLRKSKYKNQLICQNKEMYMNDKTSGIISEHSDVLFIEIEIKI